MYDPKDGDRPVVYTTYWKRGADDTRPRPSKTAFTGKVPFMFGPVMQVTEQSLKLAISQGTPPMVIFEFPWSEPNPIPRSVR